MQFQLFPLRFQFVAGESLYFPPGKAGNILRGALGLIFKRETCSPGCLETATCNLREYCLYARVFEPVAQGASPSGLADWPQPFIFRARHLEGRTIQPGETFHFDLHVFSLDPAVIHRFVVTFDALASEGLGPRRGKAQLQFVRRIAVGDYPERLLYTNLPPGGLTKTTPALVEPVSLDLSPAESAPNRVRVEFVSPTELKHGNRITNRPEFSILFGRIRDRISTLRTLYGPGPLDIDFRRAGARAAAVRMTRCEFNRHEVSRRSSRTGQTHLLGGFIGVAEYEGELAEFLPMLEAGRWVGVGRHVVWGQGEIAVQALPAYHTVSQVIE